MSHNQIQRRGITKVREHARTRTFAPAELQLLGEAIDGIECPYHAGALRFLILSGWRVGEALGLTWGHGEF